MENKNYQSKFYWVYLVGFFLILALPLINIQPWFSPPDWGKTILFRVILSALLFFLIFQKLNDKTEKTADSHGSKTDLRGYKLPLYFLITLLGLYFLATVFSVDPFFSFWGSPERGGGFLNFALCGLFSIFIFFILRNSDWRKIWDFSFIIAGLISLIAIFQQFGIFKKFLVTTGRPPATLGNSSLLAIYLLLLIFVSLSWGIKVKNTYKKIFYFSLFSLFLFVIFISGSRAIYLGLAVGILYFFFFYPKKILWLQIVLGVFLILGVLGIYCLNTNIDKVFNHPYVVENPTISSLLSRFSFNLFIIDPRFSAWQVALKGLKEKPILGWGPENFGVAFDKYYDPSLPYITKDWGSWYDRAHNFVLDIGVTAGIPALMVYLLLIGILFWQLQRLKYEEKKAEQYANQHENEIIAHGIQATFIGYLVANFFSFDSFVTYLIFFLLVAYSLFLISLNRTEIISTNRLKILDKLKKHKKPIIVILFILLIWFIWSFNIKPLIINKEIVIAEYFVSRNECNTGLNKIEGVLPQKSFLDVYSRLKYLEFITKKCPSENPEKQLEYIQKGILAAKEITKIQPIYTRAWILLGGFTNVLIKQEKDPQKRERLIKDAYSYFETAQKLSPKRPDIYIEWEKTALLGKDYEKAIEVYNKLIELAPSDYKYHASLIDIYIALNDIRKVKEEALKVLGLNPPLDMREKVEKLLEFIEENYK